MLKKRGAVEKEVDSFRRFWVNSGVLAIAVGIAIGTSLSTLLTVAVDSYLQPILLLWLPSAVKRMLGDIMSPAINVVATTLAGYILLRFFYGRDGAASIKVG